MNGGNLQNHDNASTAVHEDSTQRRSDGETQKMKKYFGFVVAMMFTLTAGAAGGLTEQLQRGLFEEEANRNLDAAIKAYESVVKQSDEERKVVATAVFRLGECYRKLGKTNEANAQYQRIVRDFSDQEALAALSQLLLPHEVAARDTATTITDPAAVKLLRDEIVLAEKQVISADRKAAAGKTILAEVLEAKRTVLRLKRLLPENSGAARQRAVLQEQIKAVRAVVNLWERRVEVGTLAPGDQWPAQRELLGLQRELAMMSNAPGLTVPSQ